MAVLFFILPWNLGKHFEVGSSYMNGILIPYLIPTIYLQDILVALITGINLARRRVARDGSRQLAVSTRLFFLFLLSCFISVFFASRVVPSCYLVCRVVLYFLFFVSSQSLFKRAFVRQVFFVSLTANLFLISLLGTVQFKNQAAVFKNYLYFGEQPYNNYTPFIAKESYGGIVKIPPYGTFEHPNILAGYLLISLTLVFGCTLRRSIWPLRFRISTFIILLFSLYVLFLTKSYTAWAALLPGVLLFVDRLPAYRRSAAGLGLGAGIVLLGLVFPLLKNQAWRLLPADSILSVLSVERRSNLLTASYRMFLEKPLFGWGINAFTYSFEPFYTSTGVVRFLQPVHNVYALIAAEIGIFGAAFFLSLIFYAIYQSGRFGGQLYSVVLVQILLLSSFDHYFFTIHQTLLLFILTLLMSLTYTGGTDCP